ncbi:methyltransferase domain-containing protein [Nannocystis sp.]|uniref:methyltransferase domain-containing protein n=1 Tax=Nannocystis sp. TaxID=1962667 RepID=UPI0034507156|nr:hypothetical protein [Nannocystis sp.]
MREASIYALPRPDTSFDLVICCGVLGHLADPPPASPGGASPACPPAGSDLDPWELRAGRILNPRARPLASRPRQHPGHVNTSAAAPSSPSPPPPSTPSSRVRRPLPPGR